MKIISIQNENKVEKILGKRIPILFLFINKVSAIMKKINAKVSESAILLFTNFSVV